MRITHSLSVDRPLDDRYNDVLAISFELDRIALFHPEPLTVEIPGMPDVIVGRGYGAFHWSMFARGEFCTACGNCCEGYRPVWFWNESDHKPEGLPQVDIKVNGKLHRWWYHVEANEQGRCHYLVETGHSEIHGLPMRLCGLHGDEDPYSHQNGPDGERNFDAKPIGCRIAVFVWAKYVPTTRGKKLAWIRRLPPRNWRWPKCPVDVYRVPPSRSVFETDLRNLRALEAAYGDLPGSQIRAGIEAFERQTYLTSAPETIFVEDFV